VAVTLAATGKLIIRQVGQGIPAEFGPVKAES
jgi:hypothetical protein